MKKKTVCMHVHQCYRHDISNLGSMGETVILNFVLILCTGTYIDLLCPCFEARWQGSVPC